MFKLIVNHIKAVVGIISGLLIAPVEYLINAVDCTRATLVQSEHRLANAARACLSVAVVTVVGGCIVAAPLAVLAGALIGHTLNCIKISSTHGERGLEIYLNLAKQTPSLAFTKHSIFCSGWVKPTVVCPITGLLFENLYA